jgi:predicted amino acid dehydrogenase
MTTLTNEEKISIVNQHIRSVDYSLYGYELDLIQANAVSSPDAGQVSAINGRIAEANAIKTALVTEKNSLTVVVVEQE